MRYLLIGLLALVGAVFASFQAVGLALLGEISYARTAIFFGAVALIAFDVCLWLFVRQDTAELPNLGGARPAYPPGAAPPSQQAPRAAPPSQHAPNGRPTAQDRPWLRGPHAGLTGPAAPARPPGAAPGSS